MPLSRIATCSLLPPRMLTSVSAPSGPFCLTSTPVAYFNRSLTLCNRRSRYVAATQYSYHSRLLTYGQRRPRACDVYFVHLHSALPGRVGFDGDGRGLRGCIGTAERGYAQHADDHLFAQDAKEGIAVVVELLKLQYTALVVNWCVHNRAAKLLLFILKGRSLCRENEKQVEIFCASSKFIYFCRKRKKKQ